MITTTLQTIDCEHVGWLTCTDADDIEAVDAIRASIAAHGWQGRPLVILAPWGRTADGLRALTGSHRSAALEALIDDTGEAVTIDVLWVEPDADDCAADDVDRDDLWDLWDARDDDDRLQVAEVLGDAALIAALQAELDAGGLA